MNARLAAFTIATASVLITQPISVVAITNNIVFTENSSTSLTVTYDGSTSGVTVTLNSPDQWTITLPSTVNMEVGSQGWAEGSTSNIVFYGDVGPSTFQVTSDEIGQFQNLAANGTNVPLAGIDTSNHGQIFATFNDNSDVPDTGSTFGLLVLALMALLGASRLCSFRLA